MSWPDLEQHRNGVLRGLLRTVERGVSDCAEPLWNSLPDKSDAYLEALARHCGFTSVGKDVVRDLLHLMISEQAQYLRQIHTWLGAIDNARDAGMAMMIDNRELAAEHLAARRAQARLRLEEPLGTCGLEIESEGWMILP